MRYCPLPTRLISRRHANRVIAHLSNSRSWIRESSGTRGEGSHYRITKEGITLGTLMLVLWPLRPHFRLWRSRNPKTSYKHAMAGIIRMGPRQGDLQALAERIRSILPASGMSSEQNYEKFLLNWWIEIYRILSLDSAGEALLLHCQIRSSGAYCGCN